MRLFEVLLVSSASRPTIDHATLARLVEVGAIRVASVIALPDGWSIIFRCGRTERPLTATRGQPRLFRKLETVVSYLTEMGIDKFEVNAGDYDRDTMKTMRSRPDTAAVMQRTHEAAAHDQWFRDQVKIGLADLRAGETISEKEHDARWSRRRAALVKRAPKA